MRVALDGSFLQLPPSGTSTYVQELAAALITVAPEIDFVLLDPRWLKVGAAPSAGQTGERGVPRRYRAFWDLVGVAAAARRAGPDLLHIPHFSAPIWLPRRVPLVVTIHDVIPLALPAYRSTRAARVQASVARRMVPRARLVLTPSLASATEIERRLHIPKDRIRVTPEAAGDAYRPATDMGAAVGRLVARRFGVTGRYVFNVGGLDVRKNLPVLLEAFAATLPRLLEPVQLVIGGATHSDNPAVFPPLAPVIERLGLGGRVVLTGFLAETDKIALYQAADLYVTPSLYEGFGLSALEAMACGTPTIAANRTSLPEVVGEGGVLVEPEANALAVAMVAILNDPARRADLRARGLARASEFSWERTAALTFAAYEEVTARPGRA